MKSIPTNALKIGSHPSATVFLEENYVLLTPEIQIQEELVRRLRAWGFSEILAEETSDIRSGHDERPDGEVTSVFIPEDSQDGAEREETRKFYTSLLEFTHKLFDLYLKKNTIPIEPINEQIKALIAMLKKNRRFLLRLGDNDRSGFPYVIGHSVNVAILSVAIGETMKLPSHKLIELGMAGLLHEIGMFRLPDSFQNAARALSTEERRALLAHPILGFRILKDLGFPPNVTMAVLEHHEKEDGSGYPQSLTGDKITVSAKILAVASGYDAQISTRPYRPARNGHASLLDLLKEIRKTYDDQILKRLIFTIGLYPIGSFVELKNGSLAQVNDSNPEDPKMPEIKILTDENKQPLPEYPVLFTHDNPDLAIQRVLNFDEVKAYKADKILPG